MKLQVVLLGSAFLTLASLPAQTTFTSPAGVANIEGTQSFLMFSNRHLQGLDDTIPGPIANINSIAFRRDGLSTSSAGVPRTMDVLLVMGTGNFASRTNTFASNFTTSTIAINNRNVNFPDWVAVPANPPAPFDFVLPFDQPWSFPGNTALIWDINCTNVSTGGSCPMDRHGWSSSTGSSASDLGTGCVATGRTSAFTHYLTLTNEGPGGNMEIRWSGFNAPDSSPTVMTMDPMDANFVFPGMCTTLHALGLITTIPTPTPTSGGSISSTTVTFPYAPAAVGVQMVTQMISFDAGIPGLHFALSNGEQGVMPPYLAVAYIWSSSTTSATGSLIAAGTIPVTQFTY